MHHALSSATVSPAAVGLLKCVVKMRVCIFTTVLSQSVVNLLECVLILSVCVVNVLSMCRWSARARACAAIQQFLGKCLKAVEMCRQAVEMCRQAVCELSSTCWKLRMRARAHPRARVRRVQQANDSFERINMSILSNLRVRIHARARANYWNKQSLIHTSISTTTLCTWMRTRKVL